MFIKVRKSKYQKKILLYLLLTSILPILVLGRYAYFTYISEFTEKIDLSNRSSLTQTMNYVDNIMDDMKRNYLEIADTDEIRWLVANHFTYKNYSQLSRAAEKLSGPTYLSNYVEGYSFIDFKDGWAFTNYGLIPLNDIINKSEIRTIFHEDFNRKNIFWLNQVNNEGISNPGREYINTDYLSLVLKLPLIGNNQKNMLIVNIKRETFEELVNNNLEEEIITIFDENGDLIFTNNMEVAQYLSQYGSEMEKITELSQIHIDEDSVYNITALHSRSSGWSYIASYNVNLFIVYLLKESYLMSSIFICTDF